MSDLSKMLEVAKSALYAYRYAMDVTSQNIANAQTTGYTRQRPDLETAISVKTPYGYLGTGVELKKIERVRDSFLDQEIRNTNYQIGDAQIQTDILNRVQAYLNEPNNGGISTELDKFFTAFQNLASNPEDLGVRETVIQQGISLTKEFNYLATGLKNEKQDIINEVQTRVKKINDIAKEISTLNSQIFSLGTSSANEMEDLRDKRLDELSKLVNITTNKDSNGLVNVSISGSTLISGINNFPLEMKSVGSSLELIYKDSNVKLSSLSGEIGAELEAYNNTIPKYQQSLDLLASTLITEVNKLHSSGYGLTNNTTGIASTGINFFSGNDANTMKINEEVKNDANKIAVSSDGSDGNNEIAQSIADLLDKPIMNDGTTSVYQYYRAFVSNIGFAVSDSQSLSDALNTRSANIENLRQSNSGVSLDDEMVNLIEYQRAFDAASKLVNTVDQMYDTLLNLKK